MKKSLFPLLVLTIAALGCSIRAADRSATATLEAKSGSSVSGTVRFTEVVMDGHPGVRVTVSARNVPQGLHGFHVHEFGDCSAPDATSAGGHFNPTSQAHGAPNESPSHAGDFGNVRADANDRVSVTYLMHNVTLGDDANSILGKAIVLHANRDDLTSQPTGDAGGRIACGVIRLDGAM